MVPHIERGQKTEQHLESRTDNRRQSTSNAIALDAGRRFTEVLLIANSRRSLRRF